MRATALQDVRCPTCKGQLDVDERQVAATTVAADFGEEIRDALLRCVACSASYPVVAGVAILIANAFSYVASNYSLIHRLAGSAVSPMLDAYWRQQGIEVVSGFDLPHIIPIYIHAQYDDLLAETPPDHPMRPMLADYGNWYARLVELAEPHIGTYGRGLDLGSSVGGLAYQLARLLERTYGLDRAFGPIFVGRCILLGQPFAQDTYPMRLDGALFRERPLSIDRARHVELVVASADSPPFATESLDVVTCANLLEVGPSPTRLVPTVSELLRSGGTFISSQVHYWSAMAGPIESWLGNKPGEPSSIDAFRAQVAASMRVVAERDWVPWVIRNSPRFYFVHLDHQLVAQKS